MGGSLLYAGGVVAGFVAAAVTLAWCARKVFGQPGGSRRGGGVAAPPPRPLAEVLADLRRLAAEADRLPDGVPMARRRGLQAAYDDVLHEAAGRLGIPHDRDDAADGERLALEAHVAAAGLVLHD